MKYCVLLLLITTSMIAGGQTKPHAPLTQQKMCADQAHKASSEYYNSKRVENAGYSYTSHYDAEAKVCYVMTHYAAVKDGQPFVSDDVFDAFEERTYASYVWINSANKKFWEVAPMVCSVKPRGQAGITCKSSEEFETLVDKYFGIGR